MMPPKVIERAPPAELAAERKDGGSLLPDDILNRVLRLYADEKRPASEVLRYV